MVLVACVTSLFGTQLSVDLDNIIRRFPAGGSLGIYIKEVGGNEIYARNAGLPLAPASVQKVVTAATALSYLGPDYTPATLVWRDGNTVNLLGGGDPGLTLNELIELKLLLDVQATDQLFFDDSGLGPERFVESWDPRDCVYAYCPTVSALTINGGRGEVWAKPGEAWVSPREFGVRIEGVPKSGKNSISVSRSFGQDWVRIGGTLPSDTLRKVATISLPDPGLAAAKILHPRPQRQSNLSPPVGVQVFEIRKRRLSELLVPCLSDSDNLYAEIILRLTGKVIGKSGSWKDSLELAAQRLERAGVMRSEFRLVDGSGLSRQNRITARAITKLLEDAFQTPGNEALFNAMATPGKGTLEKRLSGIAVRAKTGTLKGVSCLAGVLEVAEKPYIFAILMNNQKTSASHMRTIQDAIIKRLHQEKKLYAERR